MKIYLLAIAFALVALPGAAAAAAPDASRACFNHTQWKSWRAADDRKIYLRVGVSDIYAVDFVNRCPGVQWPNATLINHVSGSPNICQPVDLNLRVSTLPGFATPCIVKDFHKLTRAEADALPKKVRP